MHIRIYQLDPIRASHDARTSMLIDVSEKSAANYNLVFDGDINCQTKEDLFVIFKKKTTDRRAMHFHGHVLRTNDIIEIIEDNKSTLYEVESDGLTYCRLIETKNYAFFNLNTANDLRDCVIGVYAAPGKFAEIKQINLQSDDLNRIFGAGFEILKLSDNIHCICCGQAVTSCNLEKNRMFRDEMDESRKNIAAIHGPIFFCGVRFMPHNETIVPHSLTARECEDLIRQYGLPERFYEFNGELRSVPYYPNACIRPCLED